MEPKARKKKKKPFLCFYLNV